MGRVWLVLLAIGILHPAPAIAVPEFPELAGRVVDEARVLRRSTELAISEQLHAHEAATSNQVVVVTLQSLQGYTIEEFGVRLGIHWRIGQQDRDNGVLLIVAPNERKVRIEVGLGLEGVLTDSLAKSIIDTEILPSFRQGNLERGVRAGVDSILAAIAGTYEAPSRASRPLGIETSTILPLVPFAVFGVFALVVVLIVRDAFRDGGWRRDGTQSRDAELNEANRHWDDSSDRRGRNQRRSNRWIGGFGSGGSGGSGGGFSGGGGSFGGGGSSGSW